MPFWYSKISKTTAKKLKKCLNFFFSYFFDFIVIFLEKMLSALPVSTLLSKMP